MLDTKTSAVIVKISDCALQFLILLVLHKTSWRVKSRDKVHADSSCVRQEDLEALFDLITTSTISHIFPLIPN